MAWNASVGSDVERYERMYGNPSCSQALSAYSEALEGADGCFVQAQTAFRRDKGIDSIDAEAVVDIALDEIVGSKAIADATRPSCSTAERHDGRRDAG